MNHTERVLDSCESIRFGFEGMSFQRERCVWGIIRRPLTLTGLNEKITWFDKGKTCAKIASCKLSLYKPKRTLQ